MRTVVLNAVAALLVAIAVPAPGAKTPSKQVTRAIRKELVKDASPEKLRRPIKRQPRRMTADEAARLLAPGDHVFFPIGHMGSQEMEVALMKRAAAGAYTPEEPLHIVGMTSALTRRLFDREGRIRALSLFNGNNNRDAVSRGHGEFVPVHYGRIPQLIRQGTIRVDKAVFTVSPPDDHGWVTIGSSTGAGLAALAKAKLAIAEVNPAVPRTKGASRVHISRFHVVVDGHKPLRVIPREPPTPTEEQIAAHVASLIPNGATLQFGIGGIPNAVAAKLASRGRKGFRVWSEMISDGVVDLVKAGVVSGSVVYGFAWGSQEMLDHMNGNKKYQAMPVDVVTSPQLLPRLNKLVAVNGALEVDLLGNVNAQKVGPEMYTAVGGQLYFMAGATNNREGASIIALPSTATVGGKTISRITPQLQGGLATTSMHDVKYVVTEHGIAALDGKSEVGRAQALIAIAHPDFRGELQQAFDAQMEARRAAEERRYQKFQQEKSR